MTFSKKLNIGVIGVGHWGPNIVRNFANHPRAYLRYICDIDKTKFKKIYNLITNECRCVTDPIELFKDKDIDAVAIVSPASTHYRLVKQALLAKKHVYCEKPLTLDTQETEELCKLADNLKLKLMVAFTFLFNNGVRQLKKLKDSVGGKYYENQCVKFCGGKCYYRRRCLDDLLVAHMDDAGTNDEYDHESLSYGDGQVRVCVYTIKNPDFSANRIANVNCNLSAESK